MEQSEREVEGGGGAAWGSRGGLQLILNTSNKHKAFVIDAQHFGDYTSWIKHPDISLSPNVCIYD